MRMLKDLLQLASVPRWTTHPMLRSQSVAEHSFNVAALAHFIGGEVGYADLDRLVICALVHDGPEAKLGDIPSTAKSRIGRSAIKQAELAVCDWYRDYQLTDNEGALILEIADCLDALYFVRRYGKGHCDHFDGEQVETKLYSRVWDLIVGNRANYPQIYNTVYELMNLK